MPNYSFKLLSFVSLYCCHFLVNTSDVLTIESETENRFVLEQLWSSGFLHQTVWLGMYFNTDSRSSTNTHWPIRCSWFPCNPIYQTVASAFSWFYGLGGWFAYGLHQLAQQSPRLQAADCRCLCYYQGGWWCVALVTVHRAARLCLQNSLR